MLDQFNILNQQENARIFYASDTNTWQTWIKPRGCKFIWIMCIGAGTGGGGGGAGGAGSSPGGGSGAVTRALFPANVLPDILYVQPGLGAIGGAGSTVAANTLALAAGRSFVSITPSSATIMNLVCVSGTTGATGTSGETAATVAVAGLLSLGQFTSQAGQAGTNISQVIPLSSTITCAGGNGSATDVVAAPGIAAIDLYTLVTPSIPGGDQAVPGTPGDGVWKWKPMFGLGGAGGAGDKLVTGTAGNGGNGAYGCGGGGGGQAAGGTGTGGNGGKGGGGLVIIYTF